MNIEKSRRFSDLFIYLVFTMLAVLSTVSYMFAFLNLFICLLFTVVNDSNKVIPFLIYSTFFASIFKAPEFSSLSFFTIVLLFFIIKQIFCIRGEHIQFIISWTLLLFITTSIQILSNSIDYSRTIKFFANLIYIYIVLKGIDYTSSVYSFKLKYQNILKPYVYGLIISSLIRFLDGNIFKITYFVSQKSSSEGAYSDVLRFSGLYGDPNYYAINVVLAMCIVLAFFYQKKISTTMFCIIEVSFAVFLILTHSKSAFLMLILPLLLILWTNHKTKKYGLQMLVITSIFAIVFLSLSSKITWFDIIFYRLGQVKSLSEFTTTRTDIWLDYLTYFKNNPIQFLFGSGISTPLLNGNAAHNTYIDVLYHLGFLPGLMFISLICYLMKMNTPGIKRNIVNYSGIIALLLMYMFLSSLFDIDFPSCIIMITVLNNIPLQISKETIENDKKTFI